MEIGEQRNRISPQNLEKSYGSFHKDILGQISLLLKKLEMVDQIITDLERKVKSNWENSLKRIFSAKKLMFEDNLLREELGEYSADRTKLLEILYRLVRQTEISIKELKALVDDGKIFGEHSDVNPASDLDRSVGPKIADSVFPGLRLDETVDEEPLTAVAKLETSNDVAKVKAEDLEPKPNPENRAHPKEDLNLSLENVNRLSQPEGRDSAIEKKVMDDDFEIVDFNGLPNKEEEQEVTTNLPLTRISRSRRLARSIQGPTSDQSNQNPNNQEELTLNETTEERASNDRVENDDKPNEQPETFPSKVSLLSDSENNLLSELKSSPPTPILPAKELLTKTLLPQAESSGRVKDEEIAKCEFSCAKNFFRNQERQSMRKTKPEDLVQRKTPAEIEKIRKRFVKAEQINEAISENKEKNDCTEEKPTEEVDKIGVDAEEEAVIWAELRPLIDQVKDLKQNPANQEQLVQVFERIDNLNKKFVEFGQTSSVKLKRLLNRNIAQKVFVRLTFFSKNMV